VTGTKRPIVFLHIPKTAGQTVHSELARAVGAQHVSPVRVHTQALDGAPQMPAGYWLYSGHIDWTELDTLPNPFTFSVLRDPRERIASFYFYLLKEAQMLSAFELRRPEHLGKKMILDRSAAGYFFGGDADWQRFVHDHYDNFYCSYFATRKMRGWGDLVGLGPSKCLDRALEHVALVDRIYSTLDLGALEQDLGALLGQRLQVANRFVNVGALPKNEGRWPRLVALFDSDKDIARLQRFVETDLALIDALGLRV